MGPEKRNDIPAETRILCSGKKHQYWERVPQQPPTPPPDEQFDVHMGMNVVIRVCATCFRRAPSYILHLASWGGIRRPCLFARCFLLLNHLSPPPSTNTNTKVEASASRVEDFLGRGKQPECVRVKGISRAICISNTKNNSGS